MNEEPAFSPSHSPRPESSFTPHAPQRSETPKPDKIEPKGSTSASGSNQGRFTVGLIALYVIVFLAGILIVYASQNSQVQSAQKELSQLQNNTKAITNAQKSIDESKYQAVFMSSGQTYFGKITSLDQSYITLTDIYYLQSGGKDLQTTQSSTKGSTVSLVKLGCELHGPSDLMTINRDRVDFWENLEDSGNVAKAIKQFTVSNPAGQRCAT